MQTLNMSNEQREHFLGLGVLAINAAGQEVLHGLDVDESRFLVGCSAKPPDERTPYERQRYAELVARHERARLTDVSTDDAVSKDEASLG